MAKRQKEEVTEIVTPEKIVSTVKKEKEKKAPWTLERCRKVANRFASEPEWKKGAPSSYKSAQANGWTETILRQIAARRQRTPQGIKAA